MWYFLAFLLGVLALPITFTIIYYSCFYSFKKPKPTPTPTPTVVLKKRSKYKFDAFEQDIFKNLPKAFTMANIKEYATLFTPRTMVKHWKELGLITSDKDVYIKTSEGLTL